MRRKRLDLYEWMLIIGASYTLGIGVAIGATKLHEYKYAKMGEGLPLLEKGGHINAGNHKFVITENFYNIFVTGRTDDERQFAVDCINQACEDLNKYNSCLSFELCSTVEQMADYGVKTINSYSSDDDIELYLSVGDIDGSEITLGSTHYVLDWKNYNLKDKYIVMRNDVVLARWKNLFVSPEEYNDPYNSYMYTVTTHEALHAMGFAHREGQTIMVKSMSKAYNHLFDSDIYYMDRYNVQFYGAKPTYQKPEQNSAFTQLLSYEQNKYINTCSINKKEKYNNEPENTL